MSEQQQDFTRADIAWWQNRAARYTRHGEAQLARWSADTARRLRENATPAREGTATADTE